jgi:hypothetical protein
MMGPWRVGTEMERAASLLIAFLSYALWAAW